MSKNEELFPPLKKPTSLQGSPQCSSSEATRWGRKMFRMSNCYILQVRWINVIYRYVFLFRFNRDHPPLPSVRIVHLVSALSAIDSVRTSDRSLRYSWTRIREERYARLAEFTCEILVQSLSTYYLFFFQAATNFPDDSCAEIMKVHAIEGTVHPITDVAQVVAAASSMSPNFER